MESLIRCPRCKKIYIFFGSISEVSVCPECIAADEAKYLEVREYVRDNKGCSIPEVSDAVSVSQQTILRYLKEERLEVTGENHFLKCEACGVFINTGRLCANCSRRGDVSLTVNDAKSKNVETKIEFRQEDYR